MACVCPGCGSSKSQVRDTDSKNYDVSVKRIRQCCDCSRRFETFESMDNPDIKAVTAQLGKRLDGIATEVLKCGSDLLDVEVQLMAISE